MAGMILASPTLCQLIYKKCGTSTTYSIHLNTWKKAYKCAQVSFCQQDTYIYSSCIQSARYINLFKPHFVRKMHKYIWDSFFLQDTYKHSSLILSARCINISEPHSFKKIQICNQVSFCQQDMRVLQIKTTNIFWVNIFWESKTKINCVSIVTIALKTSPPVPIKVLGFL